MECWSAEQLVFIDEHRDPSHGTATKGRRILVIRQSIEMNLSSLPTVTVEGLFVYGVSIEKNDMPTTLRNK